MNIVVLSTFTVALLAAAAQTAKLPPQIVSCRRHDPDLDACLARAISQSVVNMKDGIKSSHVLPIDPVAISRIDIRQGGNGPVSLNLELTNITVFGITKHRLEYAKSDLDNYKMEYKGYFDALQLYAHYVMDGKFLVLPVKGAGNANGTLEGVTLLFKIHGKPLTRDGEVYWDVYQCDVVVTDVKRLRVIFNNLFNGDKLLGDATNNAINDNWREFWTEVQPAIQDAFSALAKSVINNVLKTVPEKDMFPADS